MLLVHPVHELVRFFPLVIGALVFGSAQGRNDPWHWLGVAFPVALGLTHYLTSRYRITPTQIELQRGLLSRQVLTTPLDRIRTVELTSTPVHRILGLSRVVVGTGGGGREAKKLELDALPVVQARAMRGALLHRVEARLGEVDAGADGPAQSSRPTGDEVLLTLDPRWARYAPLTTSGLVAAAALVGFLGQFTGRLVDSLEGSSGFDRARSLSLLVLAPAGLFGVLLLGAVLAVAGYFLTNWGFRLSRDTAGQSFQVRRGLLTTTELSLDTERVHGVELHQPLGLRLARGGCVEAIVTGLRKQGESRRSAIVPFAPVGVATGVCSVVLGDPTPMNVLLTPHGPKARQRRWTRSFNSLGWPAAAIIVALAWAGWAWQWYAAPLLILVAAALLAVDRYRVLGHALVGDYLVVRAHSLRNRRDVLARDGIIGWTLRQSFFQRRAGLCHLVATTSAGKQAYVVRDVPLEQAVALADDAVPGLVEQFLAA